MSGSCRRPVEKPRMFSASYQRYSGLGEWGTGRRGEGDSGVGDGETGGRGDGATEETGWGDGETDRRADGDWPAVEIVRPSQRATLTSTFALSPLPVTPSPFLAVSASSSFLPVSWRTASSAPNLGYGPLLGMVDHVYQLTEDPIIFLIQIGSISL